MKKIIIPISKDDLSGYFFVSVVIFTVGILFFVSFLLLMLPFPFNIILFCPVIGLAIFMADIFFFAGELFSLLERKNPFKFRGKTK